MHGVSKSHRLVELTLSRLFQPRGFSGIKSRHWTTVEIAVIIDQLSEPGHKHKTAKGKGQHRAFGAGLLYILASDFSYL